jgi:hypothetical protein
MDEFLSDVELAKLRPNRKREEAKARAALKAKERRAKKLTKTEKERCRTNMIAKAALVDSFATQDVRDEDGRVDRQKFLQLLAERRDRVCFILANRCRIDLLKETAFESGARNRLWLIANGQHPDVPAPPGPIKKNEYYKTMVEMDLARVLAIFKCRPESFTAKERDDINFYFYMLKDKALQPDPVAVRYFQHRWEENNKTRIWVAGQRTKSK